MARLPHRAPWLAWAAVLGVAAAGAQPITPRPLPSPLREQTPGEPMDPLVREFARFVLSREGQEIVVRDGYMLVPWEVVTDELALLND